MDLHLDVRAVERVAIERVDGHAPWSPTSAGAAIGTAVALPILVALFGFVLPVP